MLDRKRVSFLSTHPTKIATPFGVVIFMDTAVDFTCPAEMNSACAKVLATGQNACTTQKRRRPEGRIFRAVNIQIDLAFHKPVRIHGF